MEEKNTYKGIYFVNSFEEIGQYKQELSSRRMMAIIMPRSGSLQFELEGREYVLGQNDILFCIPLMLVGKYMYTPDFTARGMLLDLEQHRDIFHDMFYYEQDWWKRILFIRKHPVMHISNETIELSQHIEAIASHIKHWMQSRYSPQMLQSLLQIFVCLLMARIDELMKEEKEDSPASENVSTEQIGRSELIFKDFLVLLNSHHPHSRFCAWYAERLCITEKHLSAICKRVSGKTATQWINESVTEEIRYLLLHSEMSIKEIAMQLDFPNLSFFGKYTKQHLGCSPKKFRQQAKE